MVQLSRDEDFGALLSIEACLEKIRQEISPLMQEEKIPLEAALHRVNAHPILAPISLPSFFNSAVDGYAVRYEDISLRKLPIQGRLAAGEAPFPHKEGSATRIFTGAPMPFGADTVFMQEDVVEEAGHVFLPEGLKKYANARPIGEDIAQKSCALAQGVRLTARHIALLAALGVRELSVRARLRVGLFSTGNELVSPPHPLEAGKIYDANRFLLRALVQELGLEVVDLGILPDHQEAIATQLAAASKTCHMLITSGGVSSGEEDHVKTAVQQVGRLDYWRLGIKPGRPVAIGRIGEAHFLGLPGNPVAVFVTFFYIVKPILAALCAETYHPPLKFPLPSCFDYKKKQGRREYVRVTLSPEGVHKFARDGAGVITSLTQSQGLVELPEEMQLLHKGEIVNFIPF